VWQDRDFLVDAVVSAYQRRASQRAAINAMPLYPTEGLLWDRTQIPTGVSVCVRAGVRGRARVSVRVLVCVERGWRLWKAGGRVCAGGCRGRVSVGVSLPPALAAAAHARPTPRPPRTRTTRSALAQRRSRRSTPTCSSCDCPSNMSLLNMSNTHARACPPPLTPHPRLARPACAAHYSGAAPLALPKLNLQFLSPPDYLLRNFHLFRLEAAYEVREDIEVGPARAFGGGGGRRAVRVT
jgi:hypothetical protein